ncbi:hypothetical protein, partial [Phocaeicola sartorii]|uniref:hypothetical protein n=1 Tax=Phocaeicola sartorii TaxID=671267 RepID=UPI00258FAF31
PQSVISDFIPPERRSVLLTKAIKPQLPYMYFHQMRISLFLEKTLFVMRENSHMISDITGLTQR